MLANYDGIMGTTPDGINRATGHDDVDVVHDLIVANFQARLTDESRYTKMRMVVTDDWKVVFYVDEQGNQPVSEFIDSLDFKTKTRFDWSIEQLRIRNVNAREPLVKHIEGKIWELREESRTNIYRLMYFFFTGKQILFLHGFQKKSAKTPRREIEIAKARLVSYLKSVEERGE